MENYVIGLRRELHRNAELAFDLEKTLAIVRRELDKAGIEYTERFGKSSIVATINPEKDHFTIGIRADMDALPIFECNDVDYKSETDGIMHACGHDAHTAVALATAIHINSMRDKINCRVKFLFQAAEEAPPSGAKLMVADGVMDDIDCIIGLHVESACDAGNIAVLRGPVSANSNGFVLRFLGKSAHAADQHDGVDAISMAVQAYSQIEIMLAKQISAKIPVIFNVGSFHGGSVNNIVCDKCEMYCTLRTLTDDTADIVIKKIKKICENVADSVGGAFEYEHNKAYPVVVNNDVMYDRMYRSVVNVLGEDCVKSHTRGMGGEDFSYFAQKKPAMFIRLGIRNEGAGIINPVHTERFNIDESALAVGVKVFTQFVLDNMNGIEF